MVIEKIFLRVLIRTEKFIFRNINPKRELQKGEIMNGSVNN